MSIFDEFLTVPKEGPEQSIVSAENHSDTSLGNYSTIGNLLDHGSPYYPAPAEQYQKGPILDIDSFLNKPSSLSTQLAGRPFNWDRSNADRFIHNKNFSVHGYDPYEPAQVINGQSYDPNELRYAHLQTWGDVTKNAILGTSALAWNAGINNLKSWGHTLNALFDFSGTAYVDGFKDRFLGTPEELKAANDEQNAIFNSHAIYHTPEGDQGYFNKEFIGNMVQQLGFTIGTAAEMLGEMYLTAGIASAFAPMREASAFVRAGKGLEGLESAKNFAQAAKGTVTEGEAILNLKKTMDAGTPLSFGSRLWEGAKKFVPFAETTGDFIAAKNAGATAGHLASIGVSGIGRTLSSFNAAKAESMMEAANTYGTLYGDLLNKYQDTHDGNMPDPESMDRLKDASYRAAYDNFIVNVGLLSFMNELEFGNFMNKFSSSKRLLREAMESGEKDIFTASGTLKATGEKATRAYEKGRFGLFGDFNRVRKDFGIGTALWDIAKKFPRTQAAKFEIGEGIQEVLQNASDQTFRDYYTNLYNGGKDLDGNSIAGDLWRADGMKGLESQYNQQGFKTFLMGAVTGLFLSPLSGTLMAGRKGILSKTSESYRKAQADAQNERAENLQVLNSFFQNPANYLKPAIEGVKLQGKNAANINEALQNSDQYEYNNSKDDALSKAAAVAIKTGNYDAFLDTIKNFGNMTGEQFQKAFGVAPTGNDQLNVKTFTQKIASEIERYHDNWLALKDKYSDLVVPELYVKDTAKYTDALIAKRALDESIELLATNSRAGTRALERAISIKSELGSIPSIGTSVQKAVEILGNERYTLREINRLNEQLESLKGLEGEDVAEQRTALQEQKKHLQGWLVGFQLHHEHVNATREEYEAPGFTNFFTENREHMLKSYKGYINALNRESGNSSIVNDQDLESAYKSTADYIALNRDAHHYTEALNVLTDPQNFMKLFGKISDAIHTAQVELYDEATKGQDEGEENKKATTEQPIQEEEQKPTEETPVQDLDTIRQDIKDFYLHEPAEVTPDDNIDEEPHLSQAAEKYLQEHKELLDKINKIIALKKNSAAGKKQIERIVNEHFDNLAKEGPVTEEPATGEPQKLLKEYSLGEVYKNRNATQEQYDTVLRTTPKSEWQEGVELRISRNVPEGESGQERPFRDNPYITIVGEPYTIALHRIGKDTPLAFISNSNYIFNFDGKVVNPGDITMDQFRKVFGISRNKEAATVLQNFKDNYTKSQALLQMINEHMKGKESSVLSAEELSAFMHIVPSAGEYDFLNGAQRAERPSVEQLVATGKQLLAVTDEFTGTDIYGNSADLVPPPENSKLGNYRAAVKLPNGNIHWIELQPSVLYGKEQLDIITGQINEITKQIKATKGGEDIKLANEATKLLDTIFIATEPGAALLKIRMRKNGDIQIRDVYSNKHVVLNAGKGNEKKPMQFVKEGAPDSEQLVQRLQSEIKHKWGIDVAPGDIRLGFPRKPEAADIMKMQATVSTRVTKNYHLEYTLTGSMIPEKTVPSQAMAQEPASISGGGSVQEEDPGASLATLSQTPDDILAEIADNFGDNPLDVLDKLDGLDDANVPRKVVTPTTDFSLQSIEHIDAFRDFVNTNLPGIISVEDMGVLHSNLLDHNITVGQFLQSMDGLRNVIQVYKNSPYKYHEAFHAVFRLLLTQPQIDRLLTKAGKEVQVTAAKLQEFRDLHPSYREMDEKALHDLYLEEHLADRFHQWILNKGINTSAGIKGFFNRLLDWIKAIWSRLTGSQVEGMFYDIRRGAYRNAGLQSNNFTEGVDVSVPAMKVIKVGQQEFTLKDGRKVSVPRYLGQQEGNQLSSAIAALFVQELEGRESYNKNEILNNILDNYATLLNPRQDRYIETAKGYKNKVEMVKWLQRLNDSHKVFINEESRQSLKESVDSYLKIMGLKQSLDDDYLEELDIAETQGSKAFDKAADTIGGYENMPKAIRRYIGSTTMPYTDEFGNSHFSDGKPLVQAVNAGYVYNGLLQTLAGSVSDDQLLNRLELYRDLSPSSDTGVFINRILTESGYIKDGTGNWSVAKNQGLFQQFLNTFRQFATNPLFAEIDTGKGTTKVFNANRQDSARFQVDKWSQAFTAMYLSGYSQFSETTDKRAKRDYVNKAYKPLLEVAALLNTQAARSETIDDGTLTTLSQKVSNELKENLGINLHPLFIQYSIAAGKDESARTDVQKRLVNAYGGTYALSTDDISGIHDSLLKGENIFTRQEGENQRAIGALSRLLKIAAGNSVFDDKVWSMSYIDPEGKRRFGYQPGTYNRETVRKLNDGSYLEQLSNDPDKGVSHLLDSEQFLQMAEQDKLKVEDISGLKKVSHFVGNDGELLTYNDLDGNKVNGVSFGQMNEREFQAFGLASYISEGGKVQYGKGKEDYFYSVPVIIRVIAESSTSNMVRLPVITSAVKGNLSQDAIDILYNMVESEVARIQRVKEEISTLAPKEQITDYHNGALRGLKLYDTRNMLGELADEIEQHANDNDEVELSKVEITKQLQQYWKQQVTEYMDRLYQLGLLNKVNGKYTNRLLPKFLFEGTGNSVRDEKLNLVAGDFRHNITQVYMNDYLNRMGLVQLLYGNEAKAFKGPIDRIRRAKGANGAGNPMAFSVTAPQMGIMHPLQKFHRVLIPEPKYRQYSGNMGDKADAQMYMTTKALRYMLFGFGKLSQVQADIIDRIAAGSPVAEKEFVAAGGLNKQIDAFNSYKVVYFDGNTHLKTSVIVLTKEGTSIRSGNKWVAKPQSADLHHLRESMEAYEEQMEKAGTPTIAFASPMTASKGMNPAVAPSVRNIESSYFQQLDAGAMRLQQETPSNKLSMTDPTGLKFNVLTEQDPMADAPWLDKKVGDVMKDYLADTAQRVTNSNFAIVNSIFTRKDGTSIQLGDKVSSADITPDLGKLYDYMKRIQEATGTDAQTLAFMDTENGEPVYDLNYPATLQKFTQMVLSYLSKGVTNEKVPGITATLISGYGHKVIRQVHELTEDGQPKRWTVITNAMYKADPSRYTGYKEADNEHGLFTGLQEGDYILDDLKDTYPEYDKDGKLLGYFTEVIRPAHFKEEVGGRVVESLQNAVATRIPWDDKHQAIVAKVVDILPAYYGSVIVTADRVMEKSGSDDDGDKLFTSIPDTYRKGNERVLYGTAVTNEDKFHEYILWQLDNNKIFSDKVKELKKLYNSRTDTYTDIEGGDRATEQDIANMLNLNSDALLYRTVLSELKLPATVNEFIQRGGENLNNGVLNNRILNQKIALLSNEHISGGGKDAIINQATDTTPIKNLVDPENANSIISILRDKGVPDDAPVMKQLLGNSGLDINTLMGMGEVYDSAKSGQRNIGAAIISVMTGGFLQQYNIKGSGIMFNGELLSSFGDTTTTDGQRKFAATSAIANTMTDNLKDGNTVSKLGLTIEAVGIAATMVMQGIPLKSAMMYILQPAAREYFSKLTELNGTLKTEQESRTSKADLLSNMKGKLIDKLKDQYQDKELEQAIGYQLTDEDLINNIVDNGTDLRYQYAVLRDIDTISKEVNTLSDINKVMQLAKGYPASWEDMDAINDSLRKLGIIWNNKEERYIADESYDGDIDAREPLLNTHDIYSTYIQKFGQDRQLAKKIFIERTALFNRMHELVLDNLAVEDRFLPDFSKTLKHDLISYLSIRAYIQWLKSRGYQGALRSLDNAMIYGNAATDRGPGYQDITAVVKRLRDTLKGKKQNYLVSKFLRLVEAGKDSDINRADANTWAKLSEQQQQLLQDSFTTLYTDPRTHEDAVALFNYLLVKDGGQFKSGSFIKFIPPFAFRDLLDRTKEVNQLLSQEDYSEDKGKELFGVSYEQLLNDFMTGYATHIGNSFFVRPVREVTTKEKERSERRKPVQVDRLGGVLTVNLFGGIRESAPSVGQGIIVTEYKGKKYTDQEKEMLGANITAINGAGFPVITVEGEKGNEYKIQFPYSVKVGNSLYVLKSIDKDKGQATPSRLIEKGETIPQGIRAVYRKEDWRGSKEQWKGAGVFGQVPVVSGVITPSSKKTENPGWSSDAPKQEKVVTTNTPAVTRAVPQAVTETNTQATSQLANQGILTVWNKTDNRWDFYTETGELLASSSESDGPVRYYQQLSGNVQQEDVSSPSDAGADLASLGSDIPDDIIDEGLANCNIDIE